MFELGSVLIIGLGIIYLLLIFKLQRPIENKLISLALAINLLIAGVSTFLYRIYNLSQVLEAGLILALLFLCSALLSVLVIRIVKKKQEKEQESF